MPIITTIKEIEKDVLKEFNEHPCLEFANSAITLQAFRSGTKGWTGGENLSEFLERALTQSHKKVLEAVLEDSKRIQGDPFTDSEEFLDGMAMFKSKLITTLSDAIKTLEV